MFLDILHRFNWVDILMILIIVWKVFTAVKNGFTKELFKFFGGIFSLFIAFHYYSTVADIIITKSPLSFDATANVISFVALWVIGIFLIRLVELGVFFLFSIEAKSVIDKWGSVIVALMRSALIGSMFLFILMLTQHQYIQEMTLKSYTQRGLLKLGPKIYSVMFHQFVHKLLPDEHYNKFVEAVIDLDDKKMPKKRKSAGSNATKKDK